MATFKDTGSGFWAEQDDDAVLDYALDWSDLLKGGDTIASSVWTCSDPALIMTNMSFAGSFSAVWLSGGVAGTWYTLKNTVNTTAGRRDQRKVMLFVRDAVMDSPLGTALFPNKFTAIAKMRRDRLQMLANTILPDVSVADDYLWDKIVAAESSLAHTLRVEFQPTRFFPSQPTQAQIDELGGMPWKLDAGYDYSQDNYSGDKWGMIKTRNKPLQSVISMKMLYPTPNSVIVDVPPDWIRFDGDGGQIQIVPTGTSYPTMLGGLFMNSLAGSRTLPFTIALDYVAGIANAAREYPELTDVVFKMASLKIIEDGFLPQSGSISADGLSQSMSIDMSKYEDSVDAAINGGKGSNGGLMAKINGIRFAVM